MGILVCAVIVLAVNSLPVRAQFLAGQWELLNAQREAASDPDEKLKLQAALDLTFVYQFEDRNGYRDVPPYLKAIEGSYESIDDWEDFCAGVLQSSYHERGDSVHLLNGRPIDPAHPGPGGEYSTVKLDALFKNNEVANTLLLLIVSAQDREASRQSAELLAAIRDNKELYDRKFRRGFKSRNILQYYVDSGFQHFFLKQKKGLLSPPSTGELILLSKPEIAIGTKSLNTSTFSDNQNFYLLVPMVGWDVFVRDFKSFVGVSVFGSFPVSTEIFKNAYWGLEGHWSNKILFGVGAREDGGNVDWKMFLTVPVFLSAVPGF